MAHPPLINAFETDQYDLPPEPLADIGDEVSDHVQQSVQDAFDDLNVQIDRYESCFRSSADLNGKTCSNKDRANSQLLYLRSDKALTRAVYERLGKGMAPFSKIENWISSRKYSMRDGVQNEP